LPAELGLVEVVEGPEPGGRATEVRSELPVQDPESTGVFEVRIVALGTEEKVTKLCGTKARGVTDALFLILLDHAGGQAPVSDRAHHVLPDPERRDRVVLLEHAPVLDDRVVPLFHPGVAEREGFVAREAVRGADQTHPPDPQPEKTEKALNCT